MIPVAIERHYPKRLLTAGWRHMSLFQQPARPPLALSMLGLSPKGDLYGAAGGAGRCVPLLISITLRDAVNLVSIMVS